MTPADLAKIEADNEDSDKNDPEYIGVADTIRALVAEVRRLRGVGGIPGLSLESINLFRRYHGSRYDRRPTCSDSELTGGHVPGSNQLPRCPRCTLLIALRDGALPAGLDIETSFQGNGGD